ncbi:MAG: methyltransferase [Pseudomonadota bacterium]
MIRSTILVGASAVVLAACQTAYESDADAAVETAAEEAAPVVEEIVETVESAAPAPSFDTAAMASVLAAQPEEVQARYQYRHPAETLEFFGVAPGMTVVEALPGGGWYSKILLSYLGEDGALVGGQYPESLWLNFNGMTPERAAERSAGIAKWPEEAAAWNVPNAAAISHYYMTEAPAEVEEKVDAVIFIRALHHLHRFESKGEYFSKTVAETYKVLKPGGIVGVVQHRAPEENSDEWAIGNAGYLKQSRIIAAFEEAGFVLDGASEINANANDTPTEDEVVWRLPPVLGGTEEGTPEQAAMNAIGESDRMTLRFKKPA